MAKNKSKDQSRTEELLTDIVKCELDNSEKLDTLIDIMKQILSAIEQGR